MPAVRRPLSEPLIAIAPTPTVAAAATLTPAARAAGTGTSTSRDRPLGFQIRRHREALGSWWTDCGARELTIRDSVIAHTILAVAPALAYRWQHPSLPAERFSAG